MFARIRPRLKREGGAQDCVVVAKQSEAEKEENAPKSLKIEDFQSGDVRKFAFDDIFGPKATQEDIFKNIGAPCFESWAVKRSSVCLFTHGHLVER